jgi:hypothetical protein
VISHDRPRDKQRHDLSVRGHTTRVGARILQEIISRAINYGAEKVEVGVHRGLWSTTVFWAPPTSTSLHKIAGTRPPR